MTNGACTYNRPDGAGASSAPYTLNNAIIQRVDRLDRTTKLVLRVASVLGIF